MLSLSKKVDYALLSLAFLVERPGRISSARAIARTHDLPLPLLMNILKAMHQKGILCSERGAKGGYQICASLENVSLYDLMEAVEDAELRASPVARRLSDRPPVQALQYELIGFLKQVKLSELVVPGRRIDVPVELLRRRCGCRKTEELRVDETVHAG